MAAADMRIDSDSGNGWIDKVNEINDKVDAIMREVAQIIEDLGHSDEGGTIGQKLVQAAAGYVEKFAQMVKSFINVVEQIATYIGKAVEFASQVVETITSVAKIVAVFI